MSDQDQRFSTAEIVGSVLSAFVIGASMLFGTAMLAGNGKLNAAAMGAIVLGAAAIASKDYRSLMRLPAVKADNSDTAPPFLPRPAGQGDLPPRDPKS